MKKSIAIGAQSFEKIRQNDCFYIDKTYFIKEWFEGNDAVTLITRPRRFGKTLNMDMLNCFLSNRFANRSDLFEGLSIWEDEKYRNIQGTYPVIFLSFAGVKETNYKDICLRIYEIIRDLIRDNDYLFDSLLLSQEDKEILRDLKKIDNVRTASTALLQISKCMNKHFGKKVIILLDEYDTPLQEAYLSGYWNELSGFIKNLFNNTFKTNPYLDRAVMTGITRISKESFFSDLNNVDVTTTTSNKYETCFGFTEEEVFKSLDEFGKSSEKENIKAWYDGFIFGNSKDIYNPWSIINFLDKEKYDTYWTNTSSNNLPSRLIQKSAPRVKHIMQDLLEGQPLVTQIDEQIIFNQLDNNVDAIWSLLLASGYLKPQKVTTDEETYERTYELVLTRREVKLMFEKMFAGWFNKIEYYSEFIDSLLKNDVRMMNQYMNGVALETFSYYDTGKGLSFSAPERFYHGFVLGLLVDMRKQYQILSNRESGFGRYDVMLIPKKENLNAYVLEFKVYNQEEEKDLEETVKSGLAQIKDKNYDADLLAKGISKDRIFHYCFAFEGKKILIG